MLEKAKLEALLANKPKGGAKMEFKQLRLVFVGSPAKTHYPKLSDGSRSSESDGVSYTFTELGTSKKVTLVYKPDFKPELLEVYVASGLGYDLRQSNLIFIDENAVIQHLQ